MAEYTPHWLQWSKGESLSGIRGVKLFAYQGAERPGGPTVFWQVRELAFALGLPAATKLAKWYKDQARPNKAELPRFLETCGTSAEESVHQSVPAYKNTHSRETPVAAERVQLQHAVDNRFTDVVERTLPDRAESTNTPRL